MRLVPFVVGLREVLIEGASEEAEEDEDEESSESVEVESESESVEEVESESESDESSLESVSSELESEEETTKPQSNGVDESQGSDALQAPQVPMDEDNQPHNEHSVQPSREMQQEDLQRLDVGPDSGIGSVRSVCKLFDSDVMKETLAAIDHYVNLPQPDINGVLEESPEYQLIVRANNLSVEVDNDLMIAHKVSP